MHHGDHTQIKHKPRKPVRI